MKFTTPGVSLNTVAGNVSIQAFDDAKAAGSVGLAADAAHKHQMPVSAGIPAFLAPKWMSHPGFSPGSQAFTANTAYLVALESLGRDLSLEAILVDIGLQSGNIDLGIYSTADRATFTRVASIGSTACPAAAANVLTSLAASLSRGVEYYLAFAADNATVQLYSTASVSRLVPTSWAYSKAASFPLPASITGAAAVAGTKVPIIFAKVTGGESI